MFIRFIASAIILGLFCSCSGYKNAPLGRHSLPVDWSGVWTVNSGREGKYRTISDAFFLVSPVDDTMAKLTFTRWNSKNGEETYERSEFEASQCEIENEIIACIKMGDGYYFGVIKHKSNEIAFFPIDDTGWKKNWSSDEIGRGIAELVRIERGSAKWDADLIKKSSSDGLLFRKTDLQALPQPPKGLIAKAEQRKREKTDTPGTNLSLSPVPLPKQSYITLSHADLQAKANAGDPKALIRLAICSDVGLGVADNPRKCKELIIQAKNKNNEVGLALCQGYGWDAPFGPSPHKMVQFLEVIASEQDANNQQDARYFLAKFYAGGIGCDRSPKRAFELATAGSLAGDNACSLLMDQYMIDGIGCVSSPEIALKSIERLVIFPSPGAMRMLATCLIDGVGRERDVEGGIKILETLVKARSAKACERLGILYFFGKDTKKFSAGVEVLRKAADLGDPHALLLVSGFYDEGDRLPMNKSKADELLEDSCSMGCGKAYAELAYRLRNNNSGSINIPKIASLYTTAALFGDAESWIELALMHSETGEAPDPVKYTEYIHRAEASGDPYVKNVLLGKPEMIQRDEQKPPLSAGSPPVTNSSRPSKLGSESNRILFISPHEVAQRLAQAEKELSRGYPSAARTTAEMTLKSLSLNKPEHAEAIAQVKAIMSAASVELGLGCKNDKVREALQFYTQAVVLAVEGIPTAKEVRESLVAQNPNLMARLIGFRGVAWGRLSVIFHRLNRGEMAEKYWDSAIADMEQGRKLATIAALRAEMHTRMAHAYINRFKLGLDSGPSTKMAIVHSAEAVRTADSDPTAILAQAEAYYARALATVIVAHESGVRDLADFSLEPIWKDIGHAVKLTKGEFYNTPVGVITRKLLQTKPDPSAGVSEIAAGVFRSLVNISDPFQMPQAELEEMQRQGNAIMHDANSAAQARGLPLPYPSY